MINLEEQIAAQRSDNPDCALLIDWENFKFSLRQRGQEPSLTTLKEVAERYGRVVVAKAYADWGEHRRDAGSLYAAGIEPIYVPTTGHTEGGEIRRWKNSVDVKITADCIELAYQHPTIRVFVLVSGDQDFLHVVNTLRPSGRRVITVGLTWSTSVRLAERVDEMVFYDKAVALPAVPTPATAEPPRFTRTESKAIEQAVQRLSGRIGKLDPERRASIVSGLETLVRLVRETRAAGTPLLLSNAGKALMQELSDQQYREHFKGNLKLMAQALETAGLIRVVTTGLVDWLYLPNEQIESDAAADAVEEARS
jgi:uncharacterized LabA/DUF88 family protein